MTRVHRLRLGDPAWPELLARMPAGDIYFRDDYHALHEEAGVHARAFGFEAGGERLLYPFMLHAFTHVGARALLEVRHDIETVYGYTGPLATSEDPGFLQAAWAAFGDWCAELGVVSEFVRFHPLRETHRFWGEAVPVLAETIAVPLDPDEVVIRSRYPARQTRNMRTARAAGLVCEEIEPRARIADFERLYVATMDRLQAASSYYFHPGYFPGLVAMGEAVRLFEVRRGDATIAMALFFAAGDLAHYHLSCTDPAARNDCPVNLLLHRAATTFGREGRRWLHLGGGRTAAPDDTLLRFKTALSNTRLAFRVGRRVHDPEAFARLRGWWVEQNGGADVPGYFQLYRKPLRGHVA